MTILDLNKFALNVVKQDFTVSPGHALADAINGGPTKTSRALAIIHLAARDAYALVTSSYTPILSGLPPKDASVGTSDAVGQSAALGAALAAATKLYTKAGDTSVTDCIAKQRAILIVGADAPGLAYGELVGAAWVASRMHDGSDAPDGATYNNSPGHYRPDPVGKPGSALGPQWGAVTPFVLTDVKTDAKLDPPPSITSKQYAASYDDVFINGRDDIARRGENYRKHAAIGTFWGYDGSNMLGTPPRLYNQVVVATAEFKALTTAQQLNVLAAINAAMADAGIAAWYWKYKYDYWRPVTAIREAEASWGPSGKGDGNVYRSHAGDPFWIPLGAPKSNSIAHGGATPNFPAYPSGHATFGTACFETFANLVGKKTDEITVCFQSDEFNGETTDNEGIRRPVWAQTFTLEAAIEQNKISRIYLGVHWDFDATGGEHVGHQVANAATKAFM